MSEFHKFLEKHDLLSTSKDFKDGARAAFYSQEQKISDQKAEIDQLKAEKAGLEKRFGDALSLAEKWAAIEFEKTTHYSEGYEEGCLHCSLQLKETLRGDHE